MYALLIADEIFALREQVLLHRLEVALADEGVAVLLALPETLPQSDRLGLINEPVTYRPQSLLMPRSVRSAQLIRRIEARSERVRPDIIHAFGGSCWPMASELAEAFNAGLVLELWRSGMVSRARSFRSAMRSRTVVTAPDRWIERQLIRDRSGVQVRLTPWGGVLTPEPADLFVDGRNASIMLVGNGRDQTGVRAAFDAATTIMGSSPGAMLFIDADAAARCDLWKRARAAGVLDRVSIIDRMEDRRDLVLKGDIMLVPEARGEHRTILLDAMGAGVPIIAAADDRVSALIDHRTARLVADQTPEAWHAALAGFFDDHESARTLARSARQFIREQRRASTHAASVHDLYEWLCSSDPIAFA